MTNCTSTESRNAQRKRYYRKHGKDALRKHMPWKDEEVRAIMERALSDVELSKKIGRGVLAIQIKRTRVAKQSAAADGGKK